LIAVRNASAQSTAPRSRVRSATAERNTARNAESETMSFACQSTRSSTVGSTSSTHEKIHSAAISITGTA